MSVLVIRLNTDRGPSLARLRPKRQEMSIDDVEAAMAHDAALKALRAARAERDAAVTALTSTASVRQPAVHHDTLPRGPARQPTGADVGGVGLVTGHCPTGSGLSSYTARISFTTSDGGGNDDDITPRNSSETLSSTAANTPTLSRSATSTTVTENNLNPSSLSTSSGQTLRVNFAGTDDDDEDELVKQLRKQPSQTSRSTDHNDEDVDVDDRFVRDIIRAELPPPPPSSSSYGGRAASFTQQQPRRRHRPISDDQSQPPGAVNPLTTSHRQHFIKKSSSGVPVTTALGGPMSLRRNSAAAAAEPRRFASSLPRYPGNLNFDLDVNAWRSPTPMPASGVSSNSKQSPVILGTRSSSHASSQSPARSSNVTKPTPTPATSSDTRFGDAELHHNGQTTQLFVEVAHF